MSSVYPSALDSFMSNTDGVDDNLAADVNELQDGIVAVQGELGTDPAGTYSTVKDRLDGIDDTLGADPAGSYATVEARLDALPAFVDVTAFTPALEGMTSAGEGTYTTQVGYYSRLGNIVFFEISLNWTAHTGTGNMKITGLPFTSQNIGDYTSVTVTWNNITLPAGDKIIAVIPANASIINIYSIGSGSLAPIAMESVGILRFSGFYFV
ncbi:MAG: hypothetical protein C4583_04410 [Anaerolineaceae bacterium]|nr:MAG: hypothetical protein C4583_04410 [Anaerolineaceae bacterium]